jgi:hypothetical protein
MAGVGALYLCAVYGRGIGRIFNETYREFIDVLATASRNLNPGNKAKLSMYDFHFGAWPVEFSVFNK